MGALGGFQAYDRFIPEQFTVKAHPALFEGEGEPKKGGTIIPVYNRHTHSKHMQKHKKTHKFRTECQVPSQEIKKYRKKHITYDLIKSLQLPSAKTCENGIFSVFP